MPQQEPASRPGTGDDSRGHDDTFVRHGPEPPENDSGPSPSIEERDRDDAARIHNVDPDEQVD